MATVNPWKKFIGLLPGGVRTVGDVISIDTAASTSVVELRNGVQITARGVDVAVGLKAFIVDGDITGQAPSLPQYDIEV
ncbi:hypothetical protein [Pseudomonas sp. S9]|uniref:hypothetical protein n=1 Tax=Pseudomonas sp. S9 TaxID=686578 RepID=UPI0002557001|nr:hypothetical protein [Pseudomonas sp. S9]